MLVSGCQEGDVMEGVMRVTFVLDGDQKIFVVITSFLASGSSGRMADALDLVGGFPESLCDVCKYVHTYARMQIIPGHIPCIHTYRSMLVPHGSLHSFP